MASPFVIAGAKAKLAGLVQRVVASSCKDELMAGNTFVVVTKLSEFTVVFVSLMGVAESGDASVDPISERSGNMFHHLNLGCGVSRITDTC